MCPPNNGNGQASYNEEEAELFTLDLASICDIPIFNSLLQSSGPEYSACSANDLSLGEVSDNNSSHSLPPTTAATPNIQEVLEEKVEPPPIDIYSRSLGETSTNPNHDELSNELHEDIRMSNERFYKQQQQCNKNFLLGQNNILGDILHQNEIPGQGGQQSKPFPQENAGLGNMASKQSEMPKGSFLGSRNGKMRETTNRKRMSQDSSKKVDLITSALEEFKQEGKNYDDMDDDEDQSDDCKRRKLICKVCGDEASGFHYRVASCEACKAFFKRTVQGKIEYACPVSGNCKISPRGRKACQACRFKKCIKVGMLREGVRSDRKRGGRQKYFRRAVEPPSYISMSPSLEDSDLLRSLKSCNLDNSIMAISILEVETMTPPQIWTVLADLFNRYLKSVISNLNLFVGFNAFPLEDKLSFLKRSWSEMLTLLLTYNSSTTSGGGVAGGEEKMKLQFAPNFVLSKSKAIECGMHGFFNSCQTIVKKISALGGMHHEELLILEALVLVNSEVNLKQKEDQMGVRNKLLSLLTHCGTKFASPSNNLADAVLRSQNILLLLPSIKEADIIMRGMWSELKRQIDPRNHFLIEMIGH